MILLAKRYIYIYIYRNWSVYTYISGLKGRREKISSSLPRLRSRLTRGVITPCLGYEVQAPMCSFDLSVCLTFFYFSCHIRSLLRYLSVPPLLYVLHRPGSLLSYSSSWSMSHCDQKLWVCFEFRCGWSGVEIKLWTQIMDMVSNEASRHNV